MPSVPPSDKTPSQDPNDLSKVSKDKKPDTSFKSHTKGSGKTAWDDFLSMCTPEEKRKIMDGFSMVVAHQIDHDQKRMMKELKRERHKIENPDADDIEDL